MSEIGARPLVIVGATASGKSRLAMAIAAHRSDVEIVSIDSMQVYRGMDIGTAKPVAAERAAVPHHLIDLVDPSDDYSLARFRAEADAVLADIAQRGARPVLVGGTGLYVRAVVDRLDVPGRYPEARAAIESEPSTAELHRELVRVDPRAADRMEPTNRRRIVRALEVCHGSGRPFSSFGPGLATYPDRPFTQVGVRLPRPVIDRRIAERYHRQLEAGFLDEVRGLRAGRSGLSTTAAQALGYRELGEHLDGVTTLAGALCAAITRTRRFARRQERWFRRDPRITWYAVDENPMDLLDPLLGVFDTCY